MQNNGISKKFKICEKNRAKNLREAAKFLEDNVYTRIADLNTDERMLSADIYYHSNCLTKYIQKFNSAKSSSLPKNEKQTGKRLVFQHYVEFIEEVISRGNGITLTEIRDMINTKEDIDIKNNEVKSLIIE